MNKKYLMGFEVNLVESLGDDKLSFELLKDIREYFSKYYNVRHVNFLERSEVFLALTIEPMEVKLNSTGNDKVFRKVTKRFESIYSRFCDEFACKKFLYLVSPIYLTISPRKFAIRDERLTICRECHENLDADLGDYGMTHYNEIFDEDIRKCREHYERFIVADLSKKGLSSEQGNSFYEMIELAIKEEFGESVLEGSEPF